MRGARMRPCAGMHAPGLGRRGRRLYRVLVTPVLSVPGDARGSDLYDTLSLECDIPPELYEAASAYRSTALEVLAWYPGSGEVVWRSPKAEHKRSDDAAITVSVGSVIRITGCVALASGLANNVFCSLDFRSSCEQMLRAAASFIPFPLPPINCWRVTRVDVTRNFLLKSRGEVAQVLEYLRSYRGGRQVVKCYSSTVTWGQGSSYISGKAYAKGDHLVYLSKKRELGLSSSDIELCHRLLRVEMQIGRHKLGRLRSMGVPLTDELFGKLYDEWFKAKVGGCEVTDMSERESILKAASDLGYSKGRGMAAVACWAQVKAIGLETTRDSMPVRTWQRHIRVLRVAGIGWGDLAAGKIVPFRFRTVKVVDEVTNWGDLRRAA